MSLVELSICGLESPTMTIVNAARIIFGGVGCPRRRAIVEAEERAGGRRELLAGVEALS
jgi:hypothetical protein